MTKKFDLQNYESYFSILVIIPFILLGKKDHLFKMRFAFLKDTLTFNIFEKVWLLL